MDRSPRRLPVPPALIGFLVLLVALTGLSYSAGRIAGPVAPGMHRTVPSEQKQNQEPGMDMHGLGAVDDRTAVGR